MVSMSSSMVSTPPLYFCLTWSVTSNTKVESTVVEQHGDIHEVTTIFWYIFLPCDGIWIEVAHSEGHEASSDDVDHLLVFEAVWLESHIVVDGDGI